MDSIHNILQMFILLTFSRDYPRFSPQECYIKEESVFHSPSMVSYLYSLLLHSANNEVYILFMLSLSHSIAGRLSRLILFAT